MKKYEKNTKKNEQNVDYCKDNSFTFKWNIFLEQKLQSISKKKSFFIGSSF